MVCPSGKGAFIDSKPVLSTDLICEVCLRIVRTMVLVVMNVLLGLDPVLRDGKVEFKGFSWLWRILLKP